MNNFSLVLLLNVISYPNGILCFQLERLSKYEWKDNKQPIEEQVSRIIARLELEGKRLLEITLRNKREREAREEADRIREELAVKRKAEERAFRELLNEANRWHQASLGDGSLRPETGKSPFGSYSSDAFTNRGSLMTQKKINRILSKVLKKE